jgi:signal transduction histidine kinase
MPKAAQPARAPVHKLKLVCFVVLLIAAMNQLVPSAAGESTNSGASDFPILIQEMRTDAGVKNLELKFEKPLTPGRETRVIWEAATEPVKVRTHNRKLELTFSSQPSASHQPIRLQYQLEGFESAWHESIGTMRLVASCLDKNKRPVQSTEFNATESSPGWDGDTQTSPFVERSFKFTVPPRTDKLRLWLVSGGNRSVTGVIIADDLKVFRLGTNVATPSKVIFQDDFESGTDLAESGGNVESWVRSGTAAGLAKVLTMGEDEVNHAIGVIDPDPEQFGEWMMSDPHMVPVQPGWNLMVQFKEMHSVGGVGQVRASYEDLTLGNYRFRVREVSEFGVPTGVEAFVPIEVVPPFHQTSWFRAVVLIFVGGLTVGGFRYGAYRRLKLRLRLEREREQERARIARDIHDDLGTALTRISFLSEKLKAKMIAREDEIPLLEQIHNSAQQMTRALDEIIWAVDPGQDSLESLGNYVASMAQDILGAVNIRCRLDLPLPMPNCALPATVRHQVSLTCKEVLNNIAKHSQAEEAHMKLIPGRGSFVIILEDNGKGFDPAAKTRAGESASARAGHGLANIRHRLASVGGQAEIGSTVGQGTCIRLTVPLPGLQ